MADPCLVSIRALDLGLTPRPGTSYRIIPDIKSVTPSGSDVVMPIPVVGALDAAGEAQVNLEKQRAYAIYLRNSLTGEVEANNGTIEYQASFATPDAPAAALASLIGAPAPASSFGDAVYSAIVPRLQGGANVSLVDDGETLTIDAVGSAAGVPPGGTAGQVLAKINETDFNVNWVDPEATGGGTVSVNVGTTDTGAVGSSAAVVNSGTSQAVVLDFTIPRGDAGEQGVAGSDGASAYQVAVANGFVGDEAAWLASLVGSDGMDGSDGAEGASAYQVALAGGFVGTEAEWLASLVGADGANGSDPIMATDETDAAALSAANPTALVVWPAV